ATPTLPCSTSSISRWPKASSIARSGISSRSPATPSTSSTSSRARGPAEPATRTPSSPPSVRRRAPEPGWRSPSAAARRSSGAVASDDGAGPVGEASQVARFELGPGGQAVGVGDPVDEQDATQMIDLVLVGAGGETAGDVVELGAVTIPGPDPDL